MVMDVILKSETTTFALDREGYFIDITTQIHQNNITCTAKIYNEEDDVKVTLCRSDKFDYEQIFLNVCDMIESQEVYRIHSDAMADADENCWSKDAELRQLYIRSIETIRRMLEGDE